MIVATQALPRQGRAPDTEEPHLSASQLETFTTCSLKWWLSRRYAPERVASTLRFGGCYHKAKQCFYQGRLEGRDVTRAEMLATYESAWTNEAKRYPGIPVVFGKKETEDGLRDTAGRMFEAFLGSVQPAEVIAVEEPFKIFIADGLPPLVGTMDLIEIRITETGKVLWIVDHKSAAKRPTERSGPPKDQLVWYGLGAARKGILKQFDMPLRLRFDVVTKTKSPELVSLEVKPTRRDAERLIARTRVIWKAMQAEAVWPTAGWYCATCGFQKRCEKWPKV